MRHQFLQPPEADVDLAWADAEPRQDAPSLPIILLGALSGLGGGVLALYVASNLAGLNAPLAAGIATFVMLMMLGSVAAGLTVLTDSRAVISNVGFGCGLLALSLFFLGFCLFIGAVTATFILTLS